jgi:rhodanese-related sulfurtransferase
MGRELKRVLLEALVVAAMGLAFALLANLASPRGLSLSRNYFPGTGTAHGFESSANSKVNPAANGDGHLAQGNVAARLKEKGLRLIDHEQALQLFRDPQYELESIVFVDARDDRHYAEGHVPGAYQFDRYYPEKHLPAVLSACQNATNIIVYCTGGDCEDSEFAALTLKDSGVPLERLAVYGGGMTEWVESGLPVEIGERRSGTLRGAKP